MSNILYMQVHDFIKSLSDHCKLSFTIGVNFHENHDNRNSQDLPFQSKYIWNETSISEFQSALQSIDTMIKIQSFQNTQFETSPDGVNEALSSINSIFIDAASRSLRKKRIHVNCSRKPLHKRWFNTSLQELRHMLDYHTCSKLLSFDPFNRQLRNKCFELSKRYNRIRQKRKRLYYQTFMKKLDCLQENNPKLFWSMLNELNTSQKSEDSCLSSDSWLKHFKTMFSVQAYNQKRVDEMTHILHNTCIPPGDKNLINKYKSKGDNQCMYEP